MKETDIGNVHIFNIRYKRVSAMRSRNVSQLDFRSNYLTVWVGEWGEGLLVCQSTFGTRAGRKIPTFLFQYDKDRSGPARIPAEDVGVCVCVCVCSVLCVGIRVR